MPLEINDSLFVTQLHQRMLSNRQAGRPDDEGITAEDLAKMITIIRGNRTAAAAKTASKAGKKAAVSPMGDDELSNLFS